MLDGAVATIYVSDMNRAVAFYVQALGLRLLHRWGDEWASIDAGGGFTIGLHPRSERGPAPGTRGAISVGFNVTKPIDEVVAALQAQGVAFRGPVVGDDGGIRLAFFGDPDGNDLYLCEVSPRQT